MSAEARDCEDISIYGMNVSSRIGSRLHIVSGIGNGEGVISLPDTVVSFKLWTLSRKQAGHCFDCVAERISV